MIRKGRCPNEEEDWNCVVVGVEWEFPRGLNRYSGWIEREKIHADDEIRDTPDAICSLVINGDPSPPSRDIRMNGKPTRSSQSHKRR